MSKELNAILRTVKSTNFTFKAPINYWGRKKLAIRLSWQGLKFRQARFYFTTPAFYPYSWSTSEEESGN